MGFLCVHLQIDVYTIDGINSSDVLCRRLSVQSVYFDFNTLPRQNYFFQRVWGVFKILVEIPEGWGGVTFVVKNGNSGEEGGSYVKFPPWWGYGYFLELHIDLSFPQCCHADFVALSCRFQAPRILC